MKIGALVVNINEITYFTVDRRSSMDIMIYIYFKNQTQVWTRVTEDEIEQLTKKMENICLR